MSTPVPGDAADTVQLREYADGAVLLQFYCQGCRHLHVVNVALAPHSNGPLWTWDNNKVKPTLSPSILVTGQGRCHTFVRDGKIQFLGDCSHDHANKEVPLLPLREWPGHLKAYILS